MKPMLCRTKASLALLGMAALMFIPTLSAENKPEPAASNAPSPAITQPSDPMGDSPSKIFDDLADKALMAMKLRAEELHIKGVGLVAYVPGDDVTGWSSKMIVVGHLKTSSSTNDPGSNLLAIAYSKAAEMADTLKPSGSGVRAPMKGEFGWQGGWIVLGRTGHLIAAFSGGKSEDDVKVSKTGLEVFSGLL
jgi:hypothetical protein